MNKFFPNTLSSVLHSESIRDDLAAATVNADGLTVMTRKVTMEKGLHVTC